VSKERGCWKDEELKNIDDPELEEPELEEPMEEIK